MKILYKTKIGSHLFGTDTPDSDVDYVAIYLPTKEDLILEKVRHVINNDTNKSNTKNTKEDIDYKVVSLHHWLKLLAKGETNAVDILFSMFREDTIEYKDDFFFKYFKDLAPSLISKNCNAFIGYANAQAKKYQLKTARYTELLTLIQKLKTLPPTSQLVNHLETLSALNLEYTKIIRAPGPQKTIDCYYLEVLGRKYSEYVSIEFILARLEKVETDYASRAKHSQTTVEWKSLSHAIRVIDEVEEFMKTKHIVFPLKNVKYIKKVKAGKVPLEEVLAYMTEKTEKIDTLIKESKLPERLDVSTHILQMYKGLI